MAEDIKISELLDFSGDTAGSWLIVNKSDHSGTYKIQKESFLTGFSDGSNGTSGTSGANGTSGTSGTGVKGDTGINGTNGTSGTSGVGTGGSSGTSGEDGSSGTSGSNGTNGSSGTSGSNGTNGSSGSSGESLFVQTGSYWATTNNLQITGSVKIKGTLTADEYNITLVSSSVIYSEGSTKFGDDNNDTHQFTGSIYITSLPSGSSTEVVVYNTTSGRLETKTNASTSGSSGSNGTNGTSGSNGTNGTSGSNGTDGSSGTSGSNGTDGTDGSSGSNGTDGTSGSNGTDGSSGSNGTDGTSGSNGTDGSSGSNGTDGTSGSNGTDGSSGSNGTSGTSGATGISAGQVYYFNQSVPSGINTYRDLNIYPTAAPQTGLTVTLPGSTTGITASTFITPELGFNVIPGGTQRFHLHFLKEAVNDHLYAQVKIQLTNSSGTPIGPEIVSTPSLIGWNDSVTSVEVQTDLVLPTTTIDPTNRMLVTVMVDNADSNAQTVIWFTEGNTAYSFVLTSVGVVAGTSGSSGTSGSNGTSGDSLFISGAGYYYTTNNLQITGSVKIKGTITAEEYNVTLVSSSVLYSSGSTKFGDTSDDTHQFIGSVLVEGKVNASSLTGSINFNNLTNVPSLVSGSSQISFGGITGVPSGLVSGSGQISFNGITDKPSLVSGSSQISFTGLSNVPSGLVSGSSQVLGGTTIHSASFFNGITVVSGSGQISFNGITDKPSLVSGSSQITYSGLSGIPSGLVSGSSQISFGGITDIPSGIVSSSIQIKNYGDFATTGSNTFKGNQIISGSLTVTGSVSAPAYYEISDIRNKDIIVTNPQIDLSTLDVIQFTFKGDNQVRYGYSAQDVQKLCNDLVVGDNPLTVNYSDVHTLKIHQLENKIKQLENKIESLYVIIMDRDNQK